MNKLAPTARQYYNKLATKTQKTRFFAALFGCLPWVVFGTTKPRINLFFLSKIERRKGTEIFIFCKSRANTGTGTPRICCIICALSRCVAVGGTSYRRNIFARLPTAQKRFFHNAAKYAYCVITLSNPLKFYLEMPEI